MLDAKYEFTEVRQVVDQLTHLNMHQKADLLKVLEAILHMDPPVVPKNSVGSLVVSITTVTCGPVEHMYSNP